MLVVQICSYLCNQMTYQVSVFSQRDEVDAVSLDATHTFIAGKCGLVPVVTEYYGKQLPIDN